MSSGSPRPMSISRAELVKWLQLFVFISNLSAVNCSHNPTIMSLNISSGNSVLPNSNVLVGWPTHNNWLIFQLAPLT